MASVSMQCFLLRQTMLWVTVYLWQKMTFAHIIMGDVETEAILDYSPTDFE